MKVEILKSNHAHMIVGWEDEKGNFGRLQIDYAEDGNYTIDAEYISMKKLIEIVKAVAEL